ncbi:peptidase M16 domain protein [Ammonifex degensii KC4]|uniref:Peptidase M16 domain protein n=1 Tax=Ammonifex degensii (strain DSM 10501 / KC4) TaxID=429009 RepID=C9R8W7_AMMDK|nr:pitrilysin family protein [Ammonifex degensii]ACX52746.1 peptidase M16 domain protein [Ammonifex degensii KC4]
MVKVTDLGNGVTILTEEIPHVRSVALGIWVAAGSRDEEANQNGISHFIEHALFKGTKNRSARQIAEELESVGGQINAFTAKEYTCYYARVLDEYFELAADVLTDLVFHARFDPQDLEREKNVILEEIRMYEDTPDELVHDLFSATLWKDHPLGRPVIGTEETVKNLTSEEIFRYYERHYLRGRMVVAVAGNVTHERAVDLLAPRFAAVKEESRSPGDQPRPWFGSNFFLRSTEQVHLCLGTPGLAMGDDDIYTFQVLNTLLGGGMSSRLFQKVREEGGLVYSVYSYHSAYRDTGLFCIYAGLAAENVPRALQAIVEELKKVCRSDLSPEEVERAKNQLKGSFLLSLESVTTRMSRLGKSWLYLGRVLSPEEVAERITAVTLEQVQALARRFFHPSGLVLTTLGNWEDGASWKKILEEW